MVNYDAWILHFVVSECRIPRRRPFNMGTIRFTREHLPPLQRLPSLSHREPEQSELPVVLRRKQQRQLPMYVPSVPFLDLRGLVRGWLRETIFSTPR